MEPFHKERRLTLVNLGVGKDSLSSEHDAAKNLVVTTFSTSNIF